MKLKFNKKTIVLIFIVLLSLGVVTSLGRFIYDEIRNNFIETKKFYFESDKLKEVEALYQIDNYNGVDTYNFPININSFKNNKEKSNTDIEYEVEYSCSTNVVCDINKTSGVVYATNNSDDLFASITPIVSLNDKDTVWLTVKASATKPFLKEISAKFTLTVGYFGLAHEITDEAHKPYFELKVTNTLDYYNIIEAFNGYSIGDKIDLVTFGALSDVNKEKCVSSYVTLNFAPNTVILDTTSQVYYDAVSTNTTAIDGFLYINEIKFKIDAISSQVVRFYKKNVTNNYTYPIVNPTSIVTVTYS